LSFYVDALAWDAEHEDGQWLDKLVSLWHGSLFSDFADWLDGEHLRTCLRVYGPTVLTVRSELELSATTVESQCEQGQQQQQQQSAGERVSAFKGLTVAEVGLICLLLLCCCCAGVSYISNQSKLRFPVNTGNDITGDKDLH